ncbi:MAG: hypothetical protein LDLANPLL_02651 [Turneriella sp.]|nr:hypothetical protein [Turneriella sp.]
MRMLDVLQESKLYFTARLKDCQRTPHLHTEQIKVLSEYLKIIAASTSADDYRQKLGQMVTMFPVARAELVDKYFNFMRLYEKLGIPDKLKAAKDRYDTACSAKNHGDLVNLMGTAQVNAAQVEASGNQKLNHAVTLIQCVVAYMTEIDAEKNDRLGGILGAYTELLKLDPTFTWASYEKTPYSYVVFFDKERMARLGEVFNKVRQ